ncbi:MAG: DUF5331 domain-containing protein, partial [Microcoleus vaginatus WJT46-NPBG5]|nr:DUF5331 domain-containing protein [Microcoleus vaginatus WJT46-NPBG5]
MAFFDDFSSALKQKWLQYYQANHDWLSLHIKVAAVKTPDGGRRPTSYFILGAMNALEPKLAQLMLPFSKLNPDAETLIEVLGLNFDPDIALGNTPIGEPAAYEEQLTSTSISASAPISPATENLDELTGVNMGVPLAAVAGVGVLGVAAAVAMMEDTTDDFDEDLPDDELGGMGLGGLAESTPDFDEESSDDDDLVDMGLDALDEESSDNFAGVAVADFGEDISDDELGGIGLDELDEDSSDDFDAAAPAGFDDDTSDDELGGIDLDELGEESINNFGAAAVTGFDDDTSDDLDDDMGLGALDDDSTDAFGAAVSDDLDDDMGLGALDDDATDAFGAAVSDDLDDDMGLGALDDDATDAFGAAVSD